MRNDRPVEQLCVFSLISILFLTAFFLISCESGEGTLTVTTYPVLGSVSVDGKPQGITPVILTLSSGKHDIVFSDYSGQYEAPGTRVVTVKKDQHSTVNGEYKNIFLPQNLPPDFAPADSLRLYGTAENPLKDGTIFDYIDGGGLIYLKYGLTETTHAVLKDTNDNQLIIDIFNMGTQDGARSVFDDEEVCPSGFETCDSLMNCKAYHYMPDYFLFFLKSEYLVYISTGNDSLKTHVIALGMEMADNISRGD